MLFYRKKFLLALLEVFGGSVEGVKFQKYLFLVIERINKKHYSFVPYKFGCFSFESYNDKRSLINSGHLIEDNNQWILNNSKSFISEIKTEERNCMFSVKQEYGSLSKTALLSQIYSKHPYYAINSQIIKTTCLNAKEIKEIKKNKPKQERTCLFTIGYEGRSIDEYLNLLIKHNIKTLCDVRKNPVSRKYGFSKQSLQKKIKSLNLDYLHIPDLGIDSYLRKNLSIKQDYKKLFAFYENKILSKRKKELSELIRIFRIKKRVALTCFEAKASLCHRFYVSSALKNACSTLDVRHI